ncbi:type III secretion target, IpaC/SipC family [Serratia quinivorans]|uniref:IpaC/SipC family type III secretion system effector n=1 Tax=Serratia quinivorans TaxID=137545 RepID=UPI00217A70AC|nr:IpaC/SipC family type III secretion system effector [Serratia quinivorans]CAI1903348.1 type III secretion target, IpaC/SipC family [Serratia quinivorans]
MTASISTYNPSVTLQSLQNNTGLERTNMLPEMGDKKTISLDDITLDTRIKNAPESSQLIPLKKPDINLQQTLDPETLNQYLGIMKDEGFLKEENRPQLTKSIERRRDEQVQMTPGTVQQTVLGSPLIIADDERFESSQMLNNLATNPEYASKMAAALIANPAPVIMMLQSGANIQNAPDNMEKKSHSVSSSNSSGIMGFANDEMITVFLALISKMRKSSMANQLQMNAVFSKLSESLTKKAGELTVAAAKEQMTAAIVGFAVGGLVAGAGVGIGFKGVGKVAKSASANLPKAHNLKKQASNIEIASSSRPTNNKTSSASPIDQRHREQLLNESSNDLKAQSDQHNQSHQLNYSKGMQITTTGQTVSRLSDSVSNTASSAINISASELEQRKVIAQGAQQVTRDVAQQGEKQAETTNDSYKKLREDANAMTNKRIETANKVAGRL